MAGRTTGQRPDAQKPAAEYEKRNHDQTDAGECQEWNTTRESLFRFRLDLILIGKERAADVAGAADMNALEANELLLAQRKRQRIAVSRTSMRRHGRLLRIGQPPVRPNAAEEMAARRNGTGLPFVRPRPKAGAHVGGVAVGGTLRREPICRSERRIVTGTRADQLARGAGSGSCVLIDQRIKAPRNARTPNPHLLLVRRRATASPVLVVRASA
jgi:hypothetical protein